MVVKCLLAQTCSADNKQTTNSFNHSGILKNWRNNDGDIIKIFKGEFRFFGDTSTNIDRFILTKRIKITKYHKHDISSFPCHQLTYWRLWRPKLALTSVGPCSTSDDIIFDQIGIICTQPLLEKRIFPIIYRSAYWGLKYARKCSEIWVDVN